MPITLLIIYLAVLIILFAFVMIVVMHIGTFRDYSPSLKIVLRIYLITIILIAIFWAYKILTDTTPSKSPSTNTQKLEF